MGTVKGNGNSNMVKNYEFRDETPLNNITYYRLCQVDYDGTKTFSKTVSVKAEGRNIGKIKVYPTQVMDDVTVILPNDMPAKIMVRDAVGKVILMHNTEGVPNATLNVSNLQAGTYFLTVQAQEMIETVKIQKY